MNEVTSTITKSAFSATDAVPAPGTSICDAVGAVVFTVTKSAFSTTSAPGASICAAIGAVAFAKSAFSAALVPVAVVSSSYPVMSVFLPLISLFK